MSIQRKAEIFFFVAFVVYLLSYVFRSKSTIDVSDDYPLVDRLVHYIIPCATFLVYFVTYRFWPSLVQSDKLVLTHIALTVLLVGFCWIILPMIPTPRRYIAFDKASTFTWKQIIVAMCLIASIIPFALNIATTLVARRVSG